MGKTRLGQEVARTQIGQYVDGVYFVPLAPLSNPNDIVTTIAEVVGVVFYGDDAPPRQLVDHLKDRNLLLVLDNFEHLLDGTALVSDMISECLDVKMLATSRERLNLRGEIVYSLRGLTFPTWETPEDALEYDAVKLFMQSAQRIRPDFNLEVSHLDYLARICRLTEGMPLGIELAAGWVDVMSLEQIANEVQQSIDILETDMRDVPERQRSLRATFERTWNRLAGEEQDVFSKLSVFRGGFSTEAAQAVASANIRDLRRLAQKSLIQSEANERFSIHELLRQFGAGKVTESRKSDAIQSAHAEYFAEFMGERIQDIKTDRQISALRAIAPDFENVRIAWAHAVDQHQWEQLPKFLHALWFFIDNGLDGQVGVEMMEYALEVLRNCPSQEDVELAQGRVLAWLGWFYNDVGFTQKSADTCDEAIRILNQQNSPEDLVAAYYSRGFPAMLLVQPQTLYENAERGVLIAQSMNDIYWQGHMLQLFAMAFSLQRDFVRAIETAESSFALLQSIGITNLNPIYAILGYANLELRRLSEARYWYMKGNEGGQQIGNPYVVASGNLGLAQIAFLEADYEATLNYLLTSLEVSWEAGYKWSTANTLVLMVQLEASQNRFSSAVAILATLYPYVSQVELVARQADQLHDELHAEMNPKEFEVAWETGQLRELTDLMRELLADKMRHTVEIDLNAQPLEEPLTERELEVLALVADGYSNRDIGERLHLSIHTVKVHTRNIYGKLSVSNRTEAAATARRLNLV